MPQKHHHFTLAALVLLPFLSLAQVKNDRLAQRKRLPLEEVLRSRTDGCTLERDCLNTEMTGQCITYHNDQWFFFDSGENERLFLNVSEQNCRDLRGVQVVVFTGEPCQPRTYALFTCVSLGNQDDVFIELDGLLPQTRYLVNVDGYLEDYCRFQLQLSRTPRGLPLEPSPDMTAKGAQNGRKVRFSWELPDSLQGEVSHVEVFRRIGESPKSERIESLPVARNTYGTVQTSYHAEDSLRRAEVPHHYQLVAVRRRAAPLLIGRFRFRFKPPPTYLEITLPEVRRKTAFRISITDPLSRKLLLRRKVERHRKNTATYRVHTGYFRSFEGKSVYVEIKNLKTGKSQTRYLSF